MSEYKVRYINLPGDIRAVLRLSEDGFGNIYINDHLSPKAKREAFKHEYRHLKRGDMENDLSIYQVEK